MAKKNFPPQQQQQPGLESKMTPEPQYIRDDYKGSDKLKDKVALITGGDSGIGRSVAVHFAREGANIAIAYFSEAEDAKRTKELVENEGRKCLLLKGDLKKETFSRKIVEKTIKHFGHLNILVNNAAMQFPEQDFADLSTDHLKTTFNTNLFPYFFTTQEAMKQFRKGDCIINTTSVTAYRGSDHLVDYASSKGAIVALTRSLAAQYADKNIRINGVAPGPIWTPLIPATFSPKEVKEFGKDTPMKRAGQPCEVAPAYVYLASQDSSFMTGQVLHVNGGEAIGS